MVELVLGDTDRASRRVVRDPRVASHGTHAGPVDPHGIPTGTRSRCISTPVPPAELELLEPVEMPDLVTLGVEHVVVAVPHLAVGTALALLDDLLEGRESGREVLDGND